MPTSGLMGGLYRVLVWIMNIALINMYWILFTFVGFIIFGIIPSTVAMFATCRQLLLGHDVPLFRTFWKYYRQDFVRTNLLGFLFLAVGGILYVDILFFRGMEGLLATGATYFSYFLALLYIIIAIYIIPVYVHFKLPIHGYVKYAFMLGVSQFHKTILIVAGLYGIYFILAFSVTFGTFFFFLGSAAAMYTMWVVNTIFTKIEGVKEDNQALALQAEIRQKEKNKASTADQEQAVSSTGDGSTAD